MQKTGKSKIEKQLIGWREWVSFPELNIGQIKAKVDTGARTSALHAYNIEHFITKTGKHRVKFQVHPLQHNDKKNIYCRADVIDKRMIKSSIGQKQHRVTIRTSIKIGAEEWPIEVTLTNRDSMGFRLLLGRTAIRKRFVVDAAKSFLHGRY